MSYLTKSLTNFYASSQSSGFSKDYLGRVTLMDFSHLGDPKDLILPEGNTIFVKDFTLPGVKVEEASVKMQGNLIKDLGNVVYNEKSMGITFYTDQFYVLRKYFELIIKNQALFPSQVTANMNKINIVLSILKEDFTDAFKFSLKGAMLLGIDQVTYNTAGTGNIQELKLNFSFLDYETESTPVIDLKSGQVYTYAKRETSLAGKTADTGIRARAADLSRDRTSILGGIIQGLNNLGQVARAFGGAAGAIGGAAGSVGRATTEVRNTGRVIRNR